MFRHNWRKLWARRQRAPEAAAVGTRVETSAPAAVVRPVRERPAVLLSTLALAGNEYVAEEDIDRATLGDLFSRAFMRVTYDKDGDLWAQDYDAPKVMITVDVVRRTFGTALQLMDEYPKYTYTQSAAAYSEWMMEKYPGLNDPRGKCVVSLSLGRGSPTPVQEDLETVKKLVEAARPTEH